MKAMRFRQNSILMLTFKLLILALPFIGIIALYLHDDPFKVIRRYDIYDSDIVLNESMVGWAIYQNNKDSIPFNSFILGNSCTMAFHCNEWEKYLENGKAIRLFGNAEPIKSVYEKLKALDKQHVNIKNVLLVLDYTSLRMCTLRQGAYYILPHEITGSSKFHEQFCYIQAFFSYDFLIPYIFTYKIKNHIPDTDAFNHYGRIRNPRNNDAIHPCDNMIEKEGKSYWVRREKDFPPQIQKEQMLPQVIYKNQMAVLNDIKTIFDKQHTAYKIIISPDYKGKKLNKEDYKFMCDLFGKENVHDFSGLNKYCDKYYFYESSHYRPILGNMLLREVYLKK